MIMCIQNLVKFCPFILKLLSKLVKLCPLILKVLSINQILTSIQGCNSVANLQKMMHNNPNIDLLNDNVYTKFGLIPSIHSQDIEQIGLITRGDPELRRLFL